MTAEQRAGVTRVACGLLEQRVASQLERMRERPTPTPAEARRLLERLLAMMREQAAIEEGTSP